MSDGPFMVARRVVQRLAAVKRERRIPGGAFPAAWRNVSWHPVRMLCESRHRTARLAPRQQQMNPWDERVQQRVEVLRGKAS